MSRKDYIALAGALKGAQAQANVVLAVASVLREDNERFDLSKFLIASGIK